MTFLFLKKLFYFSFVILNISCCHEIEIATTLKEIYNLAKCYISTEKEIESKECKTHILTSNVSLTKKLNVILDYVNKNVMDTDCKKIVVKVMFKSKNERYSDTNILSNTLLTSISEYIKSTKNNKSTFKNDLYEIKIEKSIKKKNAEILCSRLEENDQIIIILNEKLSSLNLISQINHIKNTCSELCNKNEHFCIIIDEIFNKSKIIENEIDQSLLLHTKNYFEIFWEENFQKEDQKYKYLRFLEYFDISNITSLYNDLPNNQEFIKTYKQAKPLKCCEVKRPLSVKHTGYVKKSYNIYFDNLHLKEKTCICMFESLFSKNEKSIKIKAGIEINKISENIFSFTYFEPDKIGGILSENLNGLALEWKNKSFKSQCPTKFLIFFSNLRNIHYSYHKNYILSEKNFDINDLLDRRFYFISDVIINETEIKTNQDTSYNEVFLELAVKFGFSIKTDSKIDLYSYNMSNITNEVLPNKVFDNLPNIEFTEFYNNELTFYNNFKENKQSLHKKINENDTSGIFGSIKINNENEVYFTIRKLQDKYNIRNTYTGFCDICTCSIKVEINLQHELYDKIFYNILNQIKINLSSEDASNNYKLKCENLKYEIYYIIDEYKEELKKIMLLTIKETYTKIIKYSENLTHTECFLNTSNELSIREDFYLKLRSVIFNIYMDKEHKAVRFITGFFYKTCESN